MIEPKVDGLAVRLVYSWVALLLIRLRRDCPGVWPGA